MKGLLFVVVADIYNGSRQQNLEEREQVYKVYISIVECLFLRVFFLLALMFS